MNAPSTIKVETYEELEKFAVAFADGKLNLLILCGSAGLSKSQTIKRVTEGRVCWIEGNATAFGMYTELCNAQNKLVVIDDVDSLYGDRAAVRLLKSLCQTDEVKRVSWHTSAARPDKGVPREFTTTSRVCIIANDWKNLDANAEAVSDRGHLVHFVPTNESIHQEVGKWFDEPHIYDWFGQHLHLIPHLSMRSYVRAKELAASGIDWVEHLLSEQPEKARAVAAILADSSLKSGKERIEAFQLKTGASRATYFNWKKKLRAVAQNKAA